ncbi:MAG TPA: hypothetical protein PKB02_02505 [Anaerohalosphaeraceae bacterium]|nr:hypothetical protein [Anaerohalosphaeraceae bacterium]
MCEELEESLNEGHEAARRLVDHLLDMGAGKCTIPIETDDGCFIVEVRKTL